ncbi:MAG: HD domain-containing protein [Anaerolineaceae bacterium]|nr:HD domain-containing protein [Anaerolineaceae bacterium]
MNILSSLDPLIQITSAILIIGAIFSMWKKHKGFWLVLCLILDWIIMALILPLLTDEHSIINLAKFQHTSLILLSLAWLYSALQSTGWIEHLKKGQIAVIGLLPLISIALIYSNDYHGWFWTAYELTTISPIHLLENSFGFWYWVYLAHTTILMIIGTILIVGVNIRKKDFSLKRIAYILGLLFPAAGMLTFYLSHSLSISTLVFLAGSMILTWTFSTEEQQDIDIVTNAIQVEETLNSIQADQSKITENIQPQLQSWVKVLEMRDFEPIDHCRRLEIMFVELAKKMGLSAETQKSCSAGIALHDMGYLVLPDQILLKTEPLTDEEWYIIHQHPTLAMGLLKDLSLPQPSLDIIQNHHEKWDGSGYPLGQSGDTIPLVARIFSILDVWDSMVTSKPYRKAHPRQKAWQYIMDQAGKHFDPELVKAFQELMREKPEFLEGIKPSSQV